MASQYDYYNDVCVCAPENGSGAPPAAYEYYKEYCVCNGETVFLGMVDLDEVETNAYPVNVYNVSEVFIGTAADKAEYIDVWNADPTNQAIGELKNGPGPFGFLLVVTEGQAPPDYVIGDPEDVVVDTGIYVLQYGTEYE